MRVCVCVKKEPMYLYIAKTHFHDLPCVYIYLYIYTRDVSIESTSG